MQGIFANSSRPITEDPAYQNLVMSMMRMRGKREPVWKFMPSRIAKTRLVSDKRAFWQQGKSGKAFQGRPAGYYVQRMLDRQAAAMDEQPGY